MMFSEIIMDFSVPVIDIKPGKVETLTPKDVSI